MPQTLKANEAIMRGLQTSLMTIFGWGLEKFIPEEHLKPGEPLRLTPSSVRDRPHLTIVSQFL